MKNIFTFLIVAFAGYSSWSQVNDPLKRPVPGLPATSPATVGMNSDSISRMIELVRTTPPADFRGLVVIKDGKLVVEEYFNTYWRETIHDIRSAGKGVTAILLGIAIDKGLVKSVDQLVLDFFPADRKNSDVQARFKDIRLKHLLTMTSGLDANDDAPNSPGQTQNWLTKEDWVSFAMSLPIVSPPGETYVYTDVCPMLIGAIIEKTSGETLAKFAQDNLFTPLGIRDFYWYTPNGHTGPMGNLYISTLDFAKIGQLVLQKGHWQGKQIVSATWMNELSIPRLDISENPFAKSYGYFWFFTSKQANNREYQCLFASGNGGNLVFVVPSEKLVVSLTSSAYGPGVGHFRSHNIFTFVLKSLVIK
jgi:CubicO group peptidase (beta-lactamase class C family)